MKAQRITIVTIMAVAMLLAALPARAGEATTARKAEFRKLVSQRNSLHTKLCQLDQKAADSIKQGNRPVSVHADQVSTQDKLDLLQLKIEVLAARHGMAVPPLPSDKDLDGDGRSSDPTALRADRAFRRGRDRALIEVRRECLQFLESLDFEAFLRTEG